MSGPRKRSVQAQLTAMLGLALACGAGCRSEAPPPDQQAVMDRPATTQLAAAPEENQLRNADSSVPLDPLTPPSLQPLATRQAADSTGPGMPATESTASSSIAGEPPSLITASPRLELPADLPAARLADFLKLVDIEMRNVMTGKRQLTDHAEANAELTRLSQLKLRAAVQLQERSEPSSPSRSLAVRGQLQALSHLAGLGDLDSALKLETIAQEHRSSDDAGLAADSLLVLIGLEMERLQNGSASDSKQLLSLIDQIVSSPQPPDVSALMVMGQALAVLRGYGDEEAAEQIRLLILDAFANHPNQAVAEMAIGLAGPPRYAQIDKAVRDFLEGREVDPARWRSIVQQTLEESPDLATVRYLAGASLQFEAFGNLELATETFAEVQRFAGLDANCLEEIRLADEARQARLHMIGQQAEIDLPSVDGKPLSLQAQRGRVVLMPFWAIAIPDSLAILQTIAQIRQQSDGRVEIVGVNLDDDDAPVAEFLEQSPVAFRSFRSRPETTGGPHAIAARFGVVSLPFVVILDGEGRVSAINLTGRGLGDQVAKAIGPSPPTVFADPED